MKTGLMSYTQTRMSTGRTGDIQGERPQGFSLFITYNLRNTCEHTMLSPQIHKEYFM